jgi:hypothetical protein
MNFIFGLPQLFCDRDALLSCCGLSCNKATKPLRKICIPMAHNCSWAFISTFSFVPCQCQMHLFENSSNNRKNISMKFYAINIFALIACHKSTLQQITYLSQERRIWQILFMSFILGTCRALQTQQLSTNQNAIQAIFANC